MIIISSVYSFIPSNLDIIANRYPLNPKLPTFGLPPPRLPIVISTPSDRVSNFVDSSVCDKNLCTYFIFTNTYVYSLVKLVNRMPIT